MAAPPHLRKGQDHLLLILQAPHLFCSADASSDRVPLALPRALCSCGRVGNVTGRPQILLLLARGLHRRHLSSAGRSLPQSSPRAEFALVSYPVCCWEVAVGQAGRIGPPGVQAMAQQGYGFFDPPPVEGAPKKPTRQAPGRGVLDGIKKDVQAAKDGGTEYDPRGVGASWNHSFLIKKPWHPSNFRNMARVWEKEHDHYEAEKKKADAKAEFEAEQNFLQTLSMLSPEEQEKYRQRQSVSFLYMKPPGYDAALERAEKAQQAGQAVGPGGEAVQGGAQAQAQQQGQAGGAGGQQQPGPGQQQQQQQQGRGRQQVAGGHLQNMISGMQAVQQQQQQYELKHLPSAGRSPPRGGGSLEAANQQFVVGEMDSEEEEEALRLASMPPGERRRREKEAARAARQQERAAADAARRQEKATAEAQLEQAKAFLRAAGLELPSDGASSSDSGASSDTDGGASSGGGKGAAARQQCRNGSGAGKAHMKRSKKEKKEKKKKRRRKD